MSIELIAILVFGAYLAALLTVSVTILVIEVRLYRRTAADDAAIMLTIRRVEREMIDMLREAKG